jgi:hypothetical protein
MANITVKKINLDFGSKTMNPKIKIVRDFFNITRTYSYIKYMTIHVANNTNIFIKPDGKYLGLLSKYEEDSEHDVTSQIQVNIYSLPDMNPVSEEVITLEHVFTGSLTGSLSYEINWLGAGTAYEIIRTNDNKEIHDPEYSQLYLKLNTDDLYWDGYSDFRKNNKSFSKLYWQLNDKRYGNYYSYENIHETAIPIGKAPKYKYEINVNLIDVFIRKDYVAEEAYEHMENLFNSLTTNNIPIELYYIILLYMSDETIIDMINNLKNNQYHLTNNTT